jgi:lipopolysaccharide export system permease protein
MKIVSKYILKEFIWLFILCLFIFVSLFLLIDFVQKLDNLVEAGASKATIISYFFYKTPHMIIQMIPVATLIAVIVLLSVMKKNNEVMAMKACGIDILKLSLAIIIISVVVSIISFLLSELVVPYASSKSNQIWDIEIDKQDPTRFYGSYQIWYKAPNAIYWIRHFERVSNTMQNPVFYFFDRYFHMVKRIEAKRGIWQNGVWKIENGIIQESQEDGDYRLTSFDELFLEIAETPDTFTRQIKEPEDMSYQQLKTYAETVGNEGYDNTTYLVDLNLKLSFPLISLVLCILGIPLALGLRSGRIPLAVSIGVGLCFVYMLAVGFSRSLGLSGILPPLLSAWIPNLLFILAGIHMMMRLER